MSLFLKSLCVSECVCLERCWSRRLRAGEAQRSTEAQKVRLKARAEQTNREQRFGLRVAISSSFFSRASLKEERDLVQNRDLQCSIFDHDFVLPSC